MSCSPGCLSDLIASPSTDDMEMLKNILVLLMPRNIESIVWQWAIEVGDWDVINLVVNAGADVNDANEVRRWTALHYEASRGRICMVNTRNGPSPINRTKHPGSM